MNTLHTFELCETITVAGYQLCRNCFFDIAAKNHLPRCCYIDGSKVVFNLWINQGIIVYLQKCAKNSDLASIYFRVNPSLLVQDARYLSLPSDPALFDKNITFAPNSLYHHNLEDNQNVLAGIRAMLSRLPIKISFDELSLIRVDLCEDFSIPDFNTLSSYLRVAKKGLHHPNWVEDAFGDERDEHSIRRKCRRYQLTIYDKTYQMQKRFVDCQIDPAESILRVEVALLKKGIKHLAKKHNLGKGPWYETLFGLLQNGSDILVEMLDKLLSNGNYYTLSEAKTIIMNSDYRKDRKVALINFLTGVNQCSAVSKYEFMHESSSKLRVKQLATLGINITTLDARSKIPALPSFQTLIRHPQAYF